MFALHDPNNAVNNCQERDKSRELNKIEAKVTFNICVRYY